MKIYNLNSVQRALLDAMWNLDSVDELDRFLATLDSQTMSEANVLLELVHLAEVDDCVESATSWPVAVQMLSNIGVKC